MEASELISAQFSCEHCQDRFCSACTPGLDGNWRMGRCGRLHACCVLAATRALAACRCPVSERTVHDPESQGDLRGVASADVLSGTVNSTGCVRVALSSALQQDSSFFRGTQSVTLNARYAGSAKV